MPLPALTTMSPPGVAVSVTFIYPSVCGAPTLHMAATTPSPCPTSPCLATQQTFRIDALEAWLLKPPEEEEEEERQQGRGKGGASILSKVGLRVF